MSGKLVIFSAPSGAGKTTIVKNLLSSGLNLEFSISATSREPREGEIDGSDYYFMSSDQFRNKISNNEFAEWEEVYTDHYYGTLKKEIERIWESEKSVIFDVDVVGGLNLKKTYGENALAFFVMPPSFGELEKRLKSRATDSDEKIRMRLEKAFKEINRAKEFDHIIINDDLESACGEARKMVADFLDAGSKEEL